MDDVSESRQPERARVPPLTAAAEVDEVQATASSVEAVSKRRAVAARALLDAVLVDVDGEEQVRVARVLLGLCNRTTKSHYSP